MPLQRRIHDSQIIRRTQIDQKNHSRPHEVPEFVLFQFFLLDRSTCFSLRSSMFCVRISLAFPTREARSPPRLPAGRTYIYKFSDFLNMRSACQIFRRVSALPLVSRITWASISKFQDKRGSFSRKSSSSAAGRNPPVPHPDFAPY